ncbi:hypothetical protein [Franconibacter daqui]|uniref:DUF3566 domain-containing protein n=1 Tax=Franconibacter daqui TaxID=2047724 RepID=A0ABV1PN98_9ENTR
MNKEITAVVSVKQIKPGSIYRILLTGLGTSLMLLCFLFGLLACFGYDTLNWNNKPIHGLLALPASLAMGLFFSVILTALIGTLTCAGLWIYSRFRRLDINVVE